MKALVFGEILYDIIEEQEYLGGAPLNFAAHFVRGGGQADIVSAVGDDNRGWRAINEITNLNVNHTAVNILKGIQTGTVAVTLIKGEPSYHITEEVAYDFIDVNQTLPVLKGKPYDIFYFGTLAQRAEKSRSTLNDILDSITFRHVFYDVNLRKDAYTPQLIRNSLKRCTILKLNTDEVPVISQLLYKTSLSNELFCRYVKEEFMVSLIVITAAEKGCLVFANQRLTTLPGTPVQVVDTVGAGDAFSATFMLHYHHSGDAIAAAEMANLIGSFVAGKSGPIPDYTPELKQQVALLTRHQGR